MSSGAIHLEWIGKPRHDEKKIRLINMNNIAKDYVSLIIVR